MAGAGGERWVGLATDFSEGSRAALQWAADNLLRAGDQLLLLHVIKEADYEQSEAILWESTGSRTRPPPPHDPISSSDPPLLCLLAVLGLLLLAAPSWEFLPEQRSDLSRVSMIHTLRCAYRIKRIDRLLPITLLS